MNKRDAEMGFVIGSVLESAEQITERKKKWYHIIGYLIGNRWEASVGSLFRILRENFPPLTEPEVFRQSVKFLKKNMKMSRGSSLTMYSQCAWSLNSVDDVRSDAFVLSGIGELRVLHIQCGFGAILFDSVLVALAQGSGVLIPADENTRNSNRLHFIPLNVRNFDKRKVYQHEIFTLLPRLYFSTVRIAYTGETSLLSSNYDNIWYWTDIYTKLVN